MTNKKLKQIIGKEFALNGNIKKIDFKNLEKKETQITHFLNGEITIHPNYFVTGIVYLKDLKKVEEEKIKRRIFGKAVYLENKIRLGLTDVETGEKLYLTLNGNNEIVGRHQYKDSFMEEEPFLKTVKKIENYKIHELDSQVEIFSKET